MKHLIFAVILMALGYNGPPPIATLVVIPLFIKMYREFNLYKKEKNHN